MAIIHNEITIDAPAAQVWAVLADLEALEKYDPVVHKSVALSADKSGLGAERKCDVSSGWFRESVTVWEPERRLEFAISECTQPMKNLTHTYELEEVADGKTRVRQVMAYTMKFGFVGSLMDTIMGKRVADKQIKLFFAGLKKFVETGQGK